MHTATFTIAQWFWHTYMEMLTLGWHVYCQNLQDIIHRPYRILTKYMGLSGNDMSSLSLQPIPILQGQS